MDQLARAGVVSVLLLFMAGCTPASTQTPMTLVPLATEKGVSSPLPAPTLPPPVVPTHIITAAPSPVPILTPSPTDLPVVTVDPALVTPEPTAASDGPFIFVRSLASLDGVWVAEYRDEMSNYVTPDPTVDPQSLGLTAAQYHQTLVIRRRDGSHTWTIEDMLTSGLGGHYPDLLGWSANGQHFYYRLDTVRDGACRFFENDIGLIRVDVTDGKSQEIPLPPGKQHMISPDERRLAFIGEDNQWTLKILELSNGEVQKVSIPRTLELNEGWVAGGILWAPDSQALIVTLVHGDICSGVPIANSIARLDIPGLQWTLLMENNIKFATPQRWPVQQAIWIVSWQGRYWIDALTGTVTTAPQRLPTYLVP